MCTVIVPFYVIIEVYQSVIVFFYFVEEMGFWNPWHFKIYYFFKICYCPFKRQGSSCKEWVHSKSAQIEWAWGARRKKNA